ncbi:hypothetical protein [Alteribacillus bidgolensis]|nr:hypothetical protein [Alteribacillus bidgolensis]
MSAEFNQAVLYGDQTLFDWSDQEKEPIQGITVSNFHEWIKND